MPSATKPEHFEYNYFEGYYDAKYGGTQYYTSTMASARIWDKTADATLYARWTLNIIPVGTYRVIEFGEFPKTYVGNSLNTTLTNAFNSGSLTATGKVYTTNSNTATTGAYTPKDSLEYEYNGNKYVRVASIRNGTYTYLDGTNIPANATWVWFKVEPIRWIIANWYNLPTYINPDGDGTATKYQLIAEQSLVSGIPFYPNNTDANSTMWTNSTIRTYLNNTFISQAFSSDESSRILSSTIPNTNGSGVGYNSPTGQAGYDTTDKLYLLSYYEAFNASSPYNWLFNSNDARKDSPTDFALSNNAGLSTSYSSNIRVGTGYWWLRSADSSTTVRYVFISGGSYFNAPFYLVIGVRPVFALSFI